MWILVVTALWVRNTYFFEHFDCFFFSFLALETLVQLDTFLNLFTYFFQWVQRGHRVLHYHRDFFTADAQPFFFCFVFGNINAVVCNGATDNAAVCIQHTNKGFCEYRFTGTRLTYDCKCFSFIQIQRALSDCHQFAAT